MDRQNVPGSNEVIVAISWNFFYCSNSRTNIQLIKQVQTFCEGVRLGIKQLILENAKLRE
jgi:hypothetical protein